MQNGDGFKVLWEVFSLIKTTYTCTQMFSYGQTSFFETCPLNIFLTADGHGNHVSYFCTHPSLVNLLCCTFKSCLEFNINTLRLKNSRYFAEGIFKRICIEYMLYFHSDVTVIVVSLIARFMGPSGADRTQAGPMLAQWTLLSGICSWRSS